MSFMNVPCTSQTPHSLIKPVCPNKFDTDGDIWELRGVTGDIQIACIMKALLKVVLVLTITGIPSSDHRRAGTSM